MDEFKKLLDKKEEDCLLQNLLFLIKYYKKDISIDAMVSNLPLHGGFLTPKLFKKAASNAKLSCKATSLEVERIDANILPCVVFFDDETSAILLEKDEKSVKLFYPKIGLGESILTLEEFTSRFTTQLFIIKPIYEYDNKVNRQIGQKDQKRWFYDTLLENVRIYKHIIIASVLINIFVIFIPLFTMNVYDRVLPNKATDTLWVLIVGITLVLIFDLLLKLVRAYFIEIAAKRADAKMSSLIFEQILNIQLKSKPPSTGMFVSRLQSFESVREFFTSATVIAFVDLPFILLFLLIIYYIGGNLALISFVVMGITFAFSYLMQKPIKQSVLSSTKEDQIKQTILTETVTGLEIIKSIKAQNRMREHWEKSVYQTIKQSNKTHYLSQLVASIVAFVSSFSSILIVGYGVLLANSGEITMGAIIACMILNGRVIAPVSQISSMIIRLDRTLISLENINQIMNMPVEREPNKNYLSRPNLKGDIVYKDLSFSYDDKIDALKNINLKITQGEKVGIIGKIGSGKSTLAKLLLNLYTPHSGSLLIENTNIAQIDPHDLRSAIGYVPQEPFLFMGSIKENITIGSNYVSDEDILQASMVAGVHEFLGKHESGYDFLVGERGEGLSGGERQAVTLARALLLNPNILVLDEPTNMLDELSEFAFKQKVAAIIEDKTLILITHKPSLLTLVDRLIVVNDGKIVADGEKSAVLQALRGNAPKRENEK